MKKIGTISEKKLSKSNANLFALRILSDVNLKRGQLKESHSRKRVAGQLGAARQLLCIYHDSSKKNEESKRKIKKVTSIRKIIQIDMMNSNQNIMCSDFESKIEKRMILNQNLKQIE